MTYDTSKKRKKSDHLNTKHVKAIQLDFETFEYWSGIQMPFKNLSKVQMPFKNRTILQL